MAGHSQFKNIMHRKAAQDKKRGKIFTKLIREITVAAKEGGDDPNANPRLRSAIIAARSANLPKDTMDRAIKRGAGGEDDASYEEVRYEGYGPGGTAIIVQALTDNRNRTASDVRSTFTKYGGNLGESNSVTFMFDRLGVIEYPENVTSYDNMFETALEAGASDVLCEDGLHIIKCSVEDFGSIRDAMIEKYGDPQECRLTWVPQNLVSIDSEQATKMFKLIEVLEDNDDVQTVDSNFEISDDIIEKLNLG